MELQNEINKSYPPTHTFIIENLMPTQILKQRVNLINESFPGFFKGERLLDIGCNKGFFSLSNSFNFKEIIGIDNDQRSIKICNKLKKTENIKFLHISFRRFITDKQFDKIFLGNGPHHLFKEIDGHEWIAKLAAISNNEVLIEGPISNECKDISEFPEHFNEFMEKMGKYFFLIRIFPTVSYTPKRFFTLWKKKVPKSKEGIETFRKYYKKDIYTSNNKITISIAASSPISNGIMEFTGNGWIEEFNGSNPYDYLENEPELFGSHCNHQIYLSKLGYFDMDPATINYFKPNNLLFDKSGVMPISGIKDIHIIGYFDLLNRSYRLVGDEIQDRIREALESKNPIKIGSTFRWAKEKI